MTGEIDKRIRSLPPLPETLMEIQRLCQDPHEGMGKIVDVIRRDPMLMANILKVANSPFYGFSGHVASITHAVNLFGKAMIRGFVVAAAMRRHLPADMSPYGINGQDLVDISEAQRALAYRWIAGTRPEILDLVTTASFMMESGKFVVAQHLHEAGEGDAFARDLSETRDVGALERRYVGQDSFGVTADLFLHWHLGEDIAEAIRHAGNPEAAPSHLSISAWTLNVIGTCISVKRAVSSRRISSGRRRSRRGSG